jgi:hypothetical protein
MGEAVDRSETLRGSLRGHPDGYAHIYFIMIHYFCLVSLLFYPNSFH